MTLLFKSDFNEHPVHVLQIRGRTAFLAHEIGAAAGYGENGRRFVHLIVHEWAVSLDEDDDVAQITGAELAAIRREVSLPENSTVALVLFRTGVERTLMRADGKFAKSLLGFIYKDILSRVATLSEVPPEPSIHSAGTDDSSPEAPPPPRTRLWDVAACDHAAARLHIVDANVALLRYHAVLRLSEQLVEDGFIDEGTAADLNVEAVEFLLGQRLRTPLGRFGNTDAPLAA